MFFSFIYHLILSLSLSLSLSPTRFRSQPTLPRQASSNQFRSADARFREQLEREKNEIEVEKVIQGSRGASRQS